MLKVEKFVTMSPEQYEIVIEGMRNPMNSWDKSDSYKTHIENPQTLNTADFQFVLGENDKALMEKLANAGPTHRKYLRMMPVWVTITAPLYWWKEFDTYKVGTVANSCSTMHKIHEKPFEITDFSCEKIAIFGEIDDTSYKDETFATSFMTTLEALNHARAKYLEYKDKPVGKEYWYNMIQLLPTSYNQKRTVMLNYEVLANIYHTRCNHKLDEWHTLCDWIADLPYADLIIENCKEEV